jgi:homoserine O-acetyltransferase/O-succinyltransferase
MTLRALALLAFILGVALAAVAPAGAAAWPAPADGTYVVPEFRFADGETMKNLRLHYVTLGTPHRDAAGHVDNAVLILHGTGGDTNQFLRDQFAGMLFVPGGLLDASKYFIVLPDGIGHGKSSKPSDGMHARFPHYGYRDMVRAQHDLLTDALHVDHLRLVMGTSMGGMQTWLWGETYPGMMDALMPLASLPIQISGRNRVWRDMIVDDLRNDPGYRGGEYAAQPNGLKAAVDMLWIFGSAPLYDQSLLPTRDAADAYYENTVKKLVSRYDANDMIYQFESSRDYDPEPDLGKIVAPLLAVNSADDQINPPELGILEREIRMVPHGRYRLIPISAETRGHGTHTLAALWQHDLATLLHTRTLVRLPRRADGRTVLDDDVTVDLPDGWLADAGTFGLHQLRIVLQPPSGRQRLVAVLSGGVYDDDPALPYIANHICVNGFSAWVKPDSDAYQLSVTLGPGGRNDYAQFAYGPNDHVAAGIARSVRADGPRRTKHC